MTARRHKVRFAVAVHVRRLNIRGAGLLVGNEIFHPGTGPIERRLPPGKPFTATRRNLRTPFAASEISTVSKTIAKLHAKAFPGSKGNGQAWGVTFYPQGRIVVSGTSQEANGKWRFAVARYIVK